MDTTKQNFYALRAIKAFLNGDIVPIDGRQYIYQDGKILVGATVIKDGVESEIWLGGMCSEMSLEHFLNYCSSRTFEDQILDFPITIPSRF